MAKVLAESPLVITALRVRQWLGDWEKVQFDPASHKRRPDQNFYLFTLTAADLKTLSGIYRRSTKTGLLRSQDLGIQRRHDPKRSEEIRDFIHYGYPWSELSDAKRSSKQFDDLRKPGWLPTAIIVNILKPDDVRPNEERKDRKVSKEDLVSIEDNDPQSAIIRLPSRFSGPTWKPSQLHPIEVIDGQHRLWAFEEEHFAADFQLPVVAFHGLDISWQAYLFWTINIKPTRINASMAFDLIPLLRTEDWLERFEGHHIYRETRSQELTEALWANPQSPWHHRINMLGEPGGNKTVSQAAWIRSLTNTYVKSWEGPGVSIGGLFGAPVGEDREALPWNRAQQAAFLIFIWRELRDAIAAQKDGWAQFLRELKDKGQRVPGQDPAFAGPQTLLNTDQGVRGVLYVTNDLCFVRAENFDLDSWIIEKEAGATDEDAVAGALKALPKLPVGKFLRRVTQALARFDWRTSSVEGLSDRERTAKLVFRGSGGYRELRRQLLLLLQDEPDGLGETAKQVTDLLGY
jgi:hypothetical protein